VPKRAGFGGSAGNSQYSKTHTDTGKGYEEGMTGWKASRPAGGISGNNRLAQRPGYMDKSLTGDGGLAYDASMAPYLNDKGKPDKGYFP
jgi:hypothetical protein